MCVRELMEQIKLDFDQLLRKLVIGAA